MPMYFSESSLNELKELDVNSMGVIEKEGGFTGNHTSRILVIGLGGMGLKTTLRLKRELNDRLGKIDPGFLSVLSLDTDKEDREKAIKSGLLTTTEIPLLDNSAVGSILAAKNEFRPKPIGSIIPEGFTQALTGIGANQVRLAGRLTVMDLNLFGDIYNSIRNAISHLKDFSTTTLDVHVVAGIGGGSGSGLVIDVPYIVRAVVRDLGIPGNKLRLFGHVYLPNSYSGISNKEAAYRNGYAALKEIDYYMNLKTSGETFDALYPEPVGEFSSQDPIFTQCTLVGGKIAGAIVMTDPQEKAISVCVEDLVNQCTSVKGKIDGDKSGSITDFFTAGSFHVNTATALSTVMKNPDVHFPEYGNYHYNLIGASSIKFPTEAIIEQLVGEMGKKANALLKANVQSLTQADVDAFESGLIKPSDVIETCARRLAAVIDNIHSDADTRWTKGSILTNEHTVPLEAEVTKAIEAFDKDNSTIEQIVAEANRRAGLIYADPQKGPYYLEKLLTTNSKSGGNVQGFYEKLIGYADAAVALKARYEQTLAEHDRQRLELAQTMQKLGKFNSNLDSFKSLLKDTFVTRFKIRLCDSLIAEYYVDLNKARGVAYRVKLSLDRDYLGCVDIFSKINDILAENAVTASAKLSETAEKDPTSIFSLTDPEFDALKSSVMNTVSSKMRRLGENAPAQFAAALTYEIINNRAAWQLTDNCPPGMSKAAEAFRKFIKNYEPFSDVVNRKMIDYFDEAYAGQTDAYKETVIQRLINVINYNAAPMCNVWETPHFEFKHVAPLCYQYLVLPDGFNAEADASGWGTKFNDLFVKTDNNKNIYWSPDQNAIYSYTLYAKMPIWIHADLIEYEEQYNKLDMPGVHINEHAATKPAMKDYPALMVPSQWFRTRQGAIEYSNASETKLMDNVRAVVKYAKRHGIISQSDVGTWIVNLIKNKPNVSDGRSLVTIDVFVKKYIEDPSNTDEKGNIMIDKNLFAKIKASFECEERHIIGRVGNAAADEETAVCLLRNQMKLLRALEDEVEYYKENFLKPVKAADDIRVGMSTRRDLAKYMLFGLVFAERGAWKYKLGDTPYNIVSMFDVQDNNSIAWQVEYMEMAVCDAMVKLESYKEHKALLDERVKTIQRNIANGDDAAYETLKTSYDNIKNRCDTIIGAVETRRLNGNILTKEEEARKEFYGEILKAVTDIMKLFAF